MGNLGPATSAHLEDALIPLLLLQDDQVRPWGQHKARTQLLCQHREPLLLRRDGTGISISEYKRAWLDWPPRA